MRSTLSRHVSSYTQPHGNLKIPPSVSVRLVVLEERIVWSPLADVTQQAHDVRRTAASRCKHRDSLMSMLNLVRAEEAVLADWHLYLETLFANRRVP
jgi:hypothetical protein